MSTEHNGRPDLDDLDEEIREHLEAETRDNMVRGMTETDARAAALRKFGNVARVKEDVREVWFPLQSLHQDVRDAVRYLRRHPAFAMAAAAMLSIGIGLTTAIFSVVDAVLIRPLSFPAAERLVWLATRSAESPHDDMNSVVFDEWQSQSTSFEHMVAYAFSDETLVVAGEGSRIRILSASEGFWAVTGASAILGELPKAEDHDRLVLAHRTFRERFGGDQSVIGRAVTVDDRLAVIAGVLPAGFAPQLPAPAVRPGIEQVEPEAYRGMVVPPAPTSITPTTTVRRLSAFGLLEAGVSIERARQEIDTIHTRNLHARPSPLRGSLAIVSPLRERLVGPSRSALQLLLVAAVLVLLISCVNVAHLLLARSSARQREVALRVALGAGPLRVIRQLLIENLACAAIGGVAGFMLASWLVQLVTGLIGPAVPRLSETTLDFNAFIFAMAVAALTALMFGVGPAVALCRTKVHDVMKGGARTFRASSRVMTAGRGMIALQVSLTIVLLVGAGLMLTSVARMMAHPSGFKPEQLLTLRVEFRGVQYRDASARLRYARTLLATAQSLPGVTRAALTTGRASVMVVVKEGEPFPQDRAAHQAAVSAVSADLGRALGMSLVSGRWLTEADTPGAMVINEALARQEFPDRNALGERIRLPWFKEDRFGTIVGVATDVNYTKLDADVTPEAFVHYADAPLFGAMLLLETSGDPLAAAPSIRTALSAVDPAQSFFSVRTMEAALAESIAPRRFNLLLLGTFAISALFLAVLGIYGVAAYAAAERTHEIGIRIALGASRSDVVSMIVGQGMVGVVAGIVVGLGAAFATSRVIAGLLYRVDATDVSTFAISAVAITAAAVTACSVPALQAARVDPVIALRAE